MAEEERVELRSLPDGAVRAAAICSAQGKILEVSLAAPARELTPGAAAEVKSPETIYLGVIERCEQLHLWIQVEHLLDRKTLASIQAAWKE